MSTVKWKFKAGVRRLKNRGYLLPVVIALGLAISTVSLSALTTLSQNSQTLNSRYYDQLSLEAARAGTMAAIECIQSGTFDWDTGIKPKLQPQTDCHGASVSGRPTKVLNEGSIETTYSVSGLESPYGGATKIITATGTTTIKTGFGLAIKTFTRTLRTQGRLSSAGSGVVSDIDGGANHSCAVTNGKAYCWGENVNGQLGDGTNTGANVPVPVDTSGVLNSKTVTAISAGTNYSCAIANGAVYCWGNNDNGQLGNGTITSSSVPVAVDTSGVLNGKTVTAISTGDLFACAIANGQAYCWGNNNYGQLGNGKTASSSVPVAVDNAGSAAIPSNPNPCGGFFQPSCITQAQSAIPASAINGKTVTDISAGQGFACVVASGGAYCWGNNDNGQLGNGTTNGSTVAVAVSTAGVLNGKTATTISAGGAYTCAVADGKAYCWGTDTHGQLGNAQSNPFSLDFNTPQAVVTSGVLNGKTVTDISAGANHTCAAADGKAYCWGYGWVGALGDGQTSGIESNVPVAVVDSGFLSGKQVSVVTAGEGDFSCAIASDKAYCWGNDVDARGGSQLGDGGGTSNRITPYPVAVAWSPVSPTAIAITSGGDHSCAIMNGRGYCWGTNWPDGALGLSIAYGWGPGGSNGVGIPTAIDSTGVLNGKTLTDISVGSAHTCAVAGGGAYCWGDNAQGDLGNNSATLSFSPVSVDTSGALNGSTVTKIAAAGGGPGHSCAVANGQAYCWGDDASGELGDGKSGGGIYSAVPVAVYAGPGAPAIPSNPNPCGGFFQPSCITPAVPAKPANPLNGKTVAAISAGSNISSFPSGYSCAVANGKAYCWGDNSNGELGNNSTTSSSYAVTVNTTGSMNGKTVTDISAGIGFACAVANGKAYCWGDNSNGELGNNSTIDSLVPVAVNASGVLNGKTVTDISAGNGFACAVADGNAYCWGNNADGELGNNSTNNSSVPVAVYTGPAVAAVQANPNPCGGFLQPSCITQPQAAIPASALNGKTVTAISTGSTFACAVASGKVYCWGNNGNLLDGGFLGNAGADSLVAVAAVPPDVLPNVYSFDNPFSF